MVVAWAPTYILASTVAMLIAVDMPLPAEITALGIVGIVIRWALGRDDKAHAAADKRLTALEKDAAHQHTLKHGYINQITAMRATLQMMLPIAQRCTCHAVDPLIPVLERLALDTKEP